MRSGDRADQNSVKTSLIALICLAALAGTASGQQLERVEEIWGDAGPLNQSLRVLPLDMRQPVGFEHVYRFSDSSVSQPMMARIDGGLTAVFPASVYTSTRSGAVPLIPPGTIFYIGTPNSESGTWRKPMSASPLGLQRRLRLGLDPLRPVGVEKLVARPDGSGPPQTRTAATEPISTGVSIWESEAQRRSRISVLLQTGP